MPSRVELNFNEPAPRERDSWYYPPDIAHDLDDIELPLHVKGEIYACAWEYTRCVIPTYTNWSRYVAFMRTIIIGIIAEFKGSMVDVTKPYDGDDRSHMLGYNLDHVLDALFEGTPSASHRDMKREYKTFLLITSDKSSAKRDGELFRRYVNTLAVSPRHWFRMRDCDALARFTIASALACNDLNHVFTDAQYDMLCEIGDTMYDSVAFYKHRSEGETNSTFAYMPTDLRVAAFRQCREVLWALDAAWARNTDMQCVLNFTRLFGGPIHMMMRRYRFVEEGMTIGRQEDLAVVEQTRQNYKLWNRVDAKSIHSQQISAKSNYEAEVRRYQAALARSDELMFRGLHEFLEEGGDGHCDTCRYRDSYGAESAHRFGGVELCEDCKPMWREWLLSFPQRAAKVFPELKGMYDGAIVSPKVKVPRKPEDVIEKPVFTAEKRKATGEKRKMVTDGEFEAIKPAKRAKSTLPQVVICYGN